MMNILSIFIKSVFKSEKDTKDSTEQSLARSTTLMSLKKFLPAFRPKGPSFNAVSGPRALSIKEKEKKERERKEKERKEKERLKEKERKERR